MRSSRNCCVAASTLDAIHLEMRDAYGTAVELPHMAQWAGWRAR